MSAKSHGARTWWARSTTATSLAVIWLGAAAAPPVAAADGIDRLAAALNAYAPPAALLKARDLRAACGRDLLCASRRVVALWPGEAKLQRVRHPDSDTIRLVRSPPSVAGHRILPSGTVHLELVRFGRKAEAELAAAFEAAEGRAGQPATIEFDLRRNRGGDFERMVRVAAMFTGPRPEVVRLTGPGGTRLIDLPVPSHRLRVGDIRVLIGAGTASSAEVLAALLRQHAGAVLVGERTFGKDYLQRIVPVDHDWRLLIPGERIEVLGEELSGGLEPDARR